MTRDEQLSIWRAGFDAGLAVGRRQRHDRELAHHLAAIAEFREQRRADQQAKVDALVLEAVDALAKAMLGGAEAAA